MENTEQIGHCFAVLYRTVRELLFEEVVFDWRKSMESKRWSCVLHKVGHEAVGDIDVSGLQLFMRS